MELNNVKVIPNMSTMLGMFGIFSQNSHEENISGMRDLYEFNIKCIMNKILKGGVKIL